MKPVSVGVTISSPDGNLDVSKIRSSQVSVKRLVSRGKSVLVIVDSGETGRKHFDQAREYSKELADLKSDIQRVNAMLVIAALRSAAIPTHSQPFDNEAEARSFIRKMKQPTAAVV